MKRLVCAAAILSTFLCQTFAGVVVEMVSKDLRSNLQSPPDKAYAQGGMLRIEPYQEGGAAIAMIFRDDALLILNHQDKSYFRMDQQTVAQLSSQISEAMQQMQEQLKNLPPRAACHDGTDAEGPNAGWHVHGRQRPRPGTPD